MLRVEIALRRKNLSSSTVEENEIKLQVQVILMWQIFKSAPEISSFRVTTEELTSYGFKK